MLRSLEHQRLLTVQPAMDDRRVRRAVLTGRGRAEREQLDRLSDDLVRSILEPLNEGQRDRLLTAMDDVHRLLSASLIDLGPEDPSTAGARWCVDQYSRSWRRGSTAGSTPRAASPRTR
jgi:hypothetical protein